MRNKAVLRVLFTLICLGAGYAEVFTHRAAARTALPVQSITEPGVLDPTFGNGGRLIDASGYASYDVAIQPDGRIVAVSWETVVRYKVDGSPDTTIGVSHDS